MGTKVIRFDALDLSSVERAIREVEQYKADLVKAVEELVRKLTEEGREIAVLNVLRLMAFDTGELADNMRGFFSPSLQAGFIYTDVPHALFVEFGTGIKGKNGLQHPWKNEYGWEHDVHHHGDKGWIYYNDREGRCFWTKGQASRPFMLNTFQQIIQIAQARLNAINIGGGST